MADNLPREMPEFLYTIHATRSELLTEGPTPDETEILERHTEYLTELARRGVVELGGRTQNSDPTAFGLVIFHAIDESAAQELMRGDPAVSAGLMRATLYPYRVAFRGTPGGDAV